MIYTDACIIYIHKYKITASVVIGFDQQYRQINIFLLLGQLNAFISLTMITW